jgi:metal-responsive CopG/Arc/MetJ family transcriptional regulator
MRTPLLDRLDEYARREQQSRSDAIEDAVAWFLRDLERRQQQQIKPQRRRRRR